jgi:hypothetical protein
VPTQLKKQISQQEWELLKVKFTQLRLETSKGVSRECVLFYWIENHHLLMEQLVTSTILEGKKHASIDFSKETSIH